MTDLFDFQKLSILCIRLEGYAGRRIDFLRENLSSNLQSSILQEIFDLNQVLRILCRV